MDNEKEIIAKMNKLMAKKSKGTCKKCGGPILESRDGSGLNCLNCLIINFKNSPELKQLTKKTSKDLDKKKKK